MKCLTMMLVVFFALSLALVTGCNRAEETPEAAEPVGEVAPEE